ncbi:glycosyltransferase family 2 protein [Campylobacter jejuni]|uniref:glycosyltransferase family 2 protein n=1 Tax=Campylobacter jejuni TaxID=197 RepID=UPI000F80355E|nr:glycosyltransferase family 2 protein [Campylobacter jejuni]RTJ70813.1 glycosyltransferase family 2 protein [Campylobacter jejuni]
MKISIFMCCYNHAPYLERSIGSILKQTYQNWELVCVDDKSCDNSLEILDNFALNDSRIKIIKKEQNSGMAAPNCNIALEHLGGEFLLGVGPDDEITPNCLEQFLFQYNELKNKEIIVDAMILPTLFSFSQDQNKNFIHAGIKGKDFSKCENKILSGLEAFELSIDWRISGFAFFRTSLVKKFGFFEEGMNGDEFSCREFFLNSKKVGFLKECSYIYHQLDTSITKKLSVKLFDTYKTLYKVEELAKKHNLNSKIIRKINKIRYREYYYLYVKYLSCKDQFISLENKTIIEYFNESSKLLKPYKLLRDYIIRKEYDTRGKALVFFNILKFYFKRIKSV